MSKDKFYDTEPVYDNEPVYDAEPVVEEAQPLPERVETVWASIVNEWLADRDTAALADRLEQELTLVGISEPEALRHAPIATVAQVVRAVLYADAQGLVAAALHVGGKS